MNKSRLRKKWFKDCLPTMFALLMSGLYSVMDGLFIGRAVGDAGLAAVNIAWPIPAVITAAGIGIGAGGSIFYSNYMGKKDTEEGKFRYHLTMVLLLMAGIVLTAALYLTYPWILRFLGADGEVYYQAHRYSQIIVWGCLFQVLGAGIIPLLRNRGKAMGAMVSMSAGMLVNLGLNYVLIFKAGLGICGAAIGTVTAQAVVICISCFLIYGMDGERYRFVWNTKKAVENMKAGVSAFGLSLAPSVVLIFTNYQCLHYGGDAAVACYAVISYVTFPVQSILSGFGDGSQPLMSYFNGSKRWGELGYIKKTASWFAVGIGILFTLVVGIVTPWIPEVFGMSGVSGGYFSTGMRISSVAFLFLGLNRFHISYMGAILRTHIASAFIYGETLVVAPLLLSVLPRVSGIQGIWLSLPMVQMLMLLFYREYGCVVKMKQSQ